MKRKLMLLALCLLLIFGAALTVSADEATVAQDIRKDTTISGSGYDNFKFLFDKDINAYKKSSGNTTIRLENSNGMASLYLLFHLEYGEYTVTDNVTGEMITAGTYGFLHEYIDLEKGFGYRPTSVTLHFKKGIVRLSELYVFSSGKAPDYVQLWQPPLEGKTDLLLLATHGDDDQLFFAGLFPLYAKELGYRVQVVYLTDHRNLTYKRTHEMLNGLWATGVTAYPVFGDFDDFLIESLEGTYKEYERLGRSREEIWEFVITQLRRFKPLVVVGHDLAGEYAHGMHMVYSDALLKVLTQAADPNAFPESAEKYGTWDVPKTYLHLYEENPIVIDYDQPLASWDGLTAFQVTQKYGYPCHESQQYTWFTKWINGKTEKITKASQIATYNPSYFGLYRSTVGADVNGNDFMENIVPYAELERQEAERQEQEQEQKDKEKAEAEQKEKERQEQEQKEKERQEQARKEQEQREKEAARQELLKKLPLYICFGILIIMAILLVNLLRKLKQKKRRRRRRPRR